ncbi:hypothetical protein P775_08315 [Puniceibacterium antarcticum]|uniref:Uncharacterized protein n=1 Tax=Puniceibacterium antarcticum TaxID=1206336 RepID=A0A2G8RG99_9RHOB|nr:helix-turn-helix transcriptional regulator [Puniceibacterium antarcticum]PIL20523.1 hypothetical protein P775_08315 [Puniceibacterium antarcticum]
MDDKWFKQQQKKVDVTADQIAAKLGRDRSVVSRIYVGRQRMSLDQAKVFAEVLQAPLDQVLEKAGILESRETHQLVPGFSDGDASPFLEKPGRPGDLSSTLRCAVAFGGGRPGVDVWKVTSSALILDGYKLGDFILVDTHQSERTSAGDIVIAQQYNNRSGGATTLLRRLEPPVLVSATTDPDMQRVVIVDGSNVVIRGKVVASWRS